jgi:hypothetical protein
MVCNKMKGCCRECVKCEVLGKNPSVPELGLVTCCGNGNAWLQFEILPRQPQRIFKPLGALRRAVEERFPIVG